MSELYALPLVSVQLRLQSLQFDYDKHLFICDNAPYYKSQKVKDFVEKSPIKLHFLPSYSPNLNPIERLWKIMRQVVCYNKYYPSFGDFTEKINAFFKNIHFYQEAIKNRINDHFQVFQPRLIRMKF